jgi:hypothetical protein
MPTEELREPRAIDLLSRVPYGRVAASMRAMPFVAPARHIVTRGLILLRMHAGLNYHQACGGVVAYGADNFGSGAENVWSVQLTGTAQIIEPTASERELFGPGPGQVDGEPFDPVHMRLTPRFITVHMLDSTQQRGSRHAA